MRTKIQYLRDPKNTERVMTLITQLCGNDQVAYGYAINRPTRWRKCQVEMSRFEDFEKGDKFTKHMGRRIAESRLFGDSPLVANLAGREPDVAILETLRDASENSIVRRIADYRLQMVRLRDLFNKEVLDIEAAGATAK